MTLHLIFVTRAYQIDVIFDRARETISICCGFDLEAHGGTYAWLLGMSCVCRASVYVCACYELCVCVRVCVQCVYVTVCAHLCVLASVFVYVV